LDLTKLNKVLIIPLIGIILFSSVLNHPENIQTNHNLEKATEIEKYKLSPKSVTSPSSILRIGVITPAYILENEDYKPWFDPMAIGWIYDYMRNSLVYESLVHYDPQTRKINPALAHQWVVSKDGKHWTFYLREDVVFHDGSQFNASVVKFNYDRLIDPTHPAYITPKPYISLHSIPFDYVEIENQFQVTIHLKEPFAAFIHECTTIQIAAYNSYNGSEILFPYGTGPYALISSFSNNTLQNCTFSRYADYYQGLAPFEKIHYINQEAFTNAINEHSIDILLLNNVADGEIGDDAYWSLTISEEMTSIEMAYINHTNQYLRDPRVRLAINYAINRQDYIDRMNRTGLSFPMTNLIPPGVEFSNQSIIGYPYNTALANKILDEAGYPRGEDGYRFFLSIIGSEDRHPEIISEYLDAIGIYAWAENTSDWGAVWREKRYPGLLLFGSSAYVDPDLTRIYLHSSSSLNTGGFKDKNIDDLVTHGAQTPIRQEREYFYHRVQPLIQEKAPYIYLTNSGNTYVMATHLRGYLFVNKVNQIYFNYSSQPNQPPVKSQAQIIYQNQNNAKININSENRVGLNTHQYINVEVKNYPVYFPQADCVITPTQSESHLVNISMNHNLTSFLPSQTEEGKFIRIISEDSFTYRLRAYYDQIEVERKEHEQLSLSIYNEREKKWKELIALASNHTFRYLEVELTGKENLIRFNIPFTLKTYKLVPFVVFAIGGLVVSALSIVIYNFRKTKYIRRRILK
jgi:peptide/nickel transport system substrate-binding protein